MKFFSVMLIAGLVVLAVAEENSHTQNSDENETCLFLGKKYHIGELVTGSVCDRCYCTKSGLMCEMMKCPEANCHDKVKGECCWECPNGPNCLYEGENSTVLVPETGCTYSDGVVCLCYHDNRIAEETVCMPALPGDSSPPCPAYLP